MTVAVFIRHRALPGRRDELVSGWLAHMAPAIAANAGHLTYYYCLDAGDPDVVMAFQVYLDAEASRAYLASPAYAAYLADTEHLLAEPPVVTTATPIWHK